MLHSYLGAFAGILGWRHKLIYYIDGFAGAGAYSTGPTREEGSPLIAARLAQDAHGHQRYELRCINVEPDAANFENLVEATSAFGSPTVTNLRGQFAEHLPNIIQSIGHGPALFFLDPFGYRGMEWDVMRQIAERQRAASTAKTEVHVNFNIGRIDRDAGWLDSLPHKARDSFVEHVTDLMGTNDWMPIVERGLQKVDRHQQFLALYARRLATLFRGMVGTYPVRTLQGEVKYHLLHVTAHTSGMLAMSDAIAQVDGEYAQAQFAWRRNSVTG